VETVASGWNRLVGLDTDSALEVLGELDDRRRAERPDPLLYGDGEAGSRVVDELLAWLS